ncbi:MAG: Unknown protein [uncultured Campylobacterales bacterium]|uniref:Ferrous iron transporter FeoA-like domain-containing protein n=1 Tax=uncultured Campylobacterales bacterium TaxID=352960 RepID=A0A6S6SWR6_9BACT|nr:MAG: Unknown protein [uncultured Campylobacterales bacterium]
MLLSDLKQKQSAIITKINSDEETEDRLYSLGLVEGIQILIDKYSMAKQTIIISLQSQTLAIGLGEAKQIEVEITK